MNGYNTKINVLTALISAILEGPPKNHNSSVNFSHLGAVLDWIAHHRAAVLRLRIGTGPSGAAWDVPTPGGEMLEIMLKELDRHEKKTRDTLLEMLESSKPVQKS